MKLVIVDSFKAWSVTFGSTIIYGIIIGFLKTYSLVIIEYQDLIDAPMSILMFSACLLNSLIGFSGPLATYLSERFTTWKVASYGSIMSSVAVLIMAFASNIFVLLISTFITGFAFSLIFVPTYSIPGKCHIKHQSLSQSIVSAGASFCTILMPLGMSLLIKTYSIRGVMVIMAGYMLHSTIGAVLMPTHIIEIRDNYKPVLVSMQDPKKPPEGSVIKIYKWNATYKSFSGNSKVSWPPRKLWRTLILLSIGLGVVMNGHMLLIYLYGPFTRYLNITVENAAFLLILHSIVDCFARLAVGYISDLKLISRWILYCLNSMALCFISILVGIFPSKSLFYVYLFCNAVFGSFVVVLTILILIDNIGIEYISVSFTCYLFVQGGISFCLFYVIGYFCDVTGMYNYAILICGLLIGLGTMLIIIDRCIEFL